MENVFLLGNHLLEGFYLQKLIKKFTMSFEIEGSIHKIFETTSKTATFQAREFILEIQDGNYPQLIKFQLTQDRCDIIDSYKAGDQIKVHFSLRGREWNDKYFTNLNAWRIEANQPEAESPSSDFPELGEAAPEKGGNSDQEMKLEDFDDLPF